MWGTLIHASFRFLAHDLKAVTGVVDHGLFLDMADEAIVGIDGGVERVLP